MNYLSKISTLFSICLCLSINSQVSISAGLGSVSGFTTDKSHVGFHAGVELPRNNDVTFYGRLAHYFSRSEDEGTTRTVIIQDLNDLTLPYQLQVNARESFNYTTIEGGTRYYLGNDYDNGFSAYGGTNGMLVFNTVKLKYDKTDITGTYEWEENYALPSNDDERGLIMGIAVGLQGGVKYTIPAIGTAYFDVSGQYSILAQGNNDVANFTNQYSQLFFVFTVGFRKDLY
ncbi:hypothetical protein N9335_02430 [Crocinitomicaceae bacterium]|nr:hypothetical protein [Crocinitomicaceae bacterium]